MKNSGGGFRGGGNGGSRVPKDKEIPAAPRGLSAESKGWWGKILRQVEMEKAHLLLLQTTLEALDRMRMAQKEIKRNKAVTVCDRFGQVKPHPACTVERDSRSAVVLGLKTLGLNLPFEEGDE